MMHHRIDILNILIVIIITIIIIIINIFVSVVTRILCQAPTVNYFKTVGPCGGCINNIVAAPAQPVQHGMFFHEPYTVPASKYPGEQEKILYDHNNNNNDIFIIHKNNNKTSKKLEKKKMNFI